MSSTETENPEVLPEVIRPDGEIVVGVTRREEFGAVTETMAGETASGAVAAQAAAQVQARYVMAVRNPRDLDAVRQDLLKDCARPGFAATAEYAKPIGQGKVVGPSIRFVENALRRFRNVLIETPVIFDSPKTRIVRVRVTDLESNLTQEKDVAVEKTVERSKPRPTPELPLGFISSRENTSGGRTYLVLATDDEILGKENALISKSMRNAGLRILPGDLVEDAIAACRTTRQKADKADPDAARKQLIDAFAKLHVTVSDLKAYAGDDLAKLSPAQLDDLRSIWNAIKEGEVTWKSVMDAKGARDEAESSGANRDRADALLNKIESGKGPKAATGGKF